MRSFYIGYKYISKSITIKANIKQKFIIITTNSNKKVYNAKNEDK